MVIIIITNSSQQDKKIIKAGENKIKQKLS